MQPIVSITLLLLTLSFSACGQPPRGEKPSATAVTPKLVGGPCEGCEAIFENTGEPTWIDTLAGPEEPGERMIIRGVIFRPDGRTPAPGVILYVYHTNAEGRYPTRGGEKGWARRHGYLRGWVRTDAQGRYQIVSIRPASYPNSRVSQHIHPIIYEPGAGIYYYIDEFVFDDDPMLTDVERTRSHPRGGRGVVRLVKNRNGVWEGSRDITLGLNVPGYPSPAGGGRTQSGPARYLLAPPGEAGERLELAVQVIDKASRRPIPEAEALFYQTNAQGRYEPLDPRDESTARLHSPARTGSTGRFLLSTILPGEYPDAPKGNRHIHLHYLRAPGYPEIGRVILFEHNVNDEVREWARKTDFGIIADIRKQNGTWTGEITLELAAVAGKGASQVISTRASSPSQPLLTLSGAEKILGQKAHVAHDSTSVEDGVSAHYLTYTANEKDLVSGKTGNLYFMSEQYEQVEAARKVYAAIYTSNKTHPGVEVLSGLGDEAYFHGDEHFYFILVRKGTNLFRMKLNKVTSKTSLVEFKGAAGKMAQLI